MSMSWRAAHSRTASSLPLAHTNGPTIGRRRSRRRSRRTSSPRRRRTRDARPAGGRGRPGWGGHHQAPPAALCCSTTGPAKGWTIPTRTSAAASAAAWTLGGSGPWPSRGLAGQHHAGQVSPTRLNSPYIIRSPGIDRPMSPADRIASAKTWPLPPESRVRSRSKNAADRPPREPWRLTVTQNGKAPLEERRLSTVEPKRLGEPWSGSYRAGLGEPRFELVKVCTNFGIYQPAPTDNAHRF